MYRNQVPSPSFYAIENCNHSWRELYKAAIFEKDDGKGANRILAAEQVIVNRVRDLFQTKDASEERMALDAALSALQVLKPYSRPKDLV
jgi:hypothetical protein